MDQPADKRVSPKSILMGVGILAVFAWCYHRTFYEMWLRWFPAWKYSQWSVYDRLFEGEGYYTHGPLVVLISALIAVMLLRFTKIRTQPSPKFGAVVLIGSVMVHWLAALAQVNFLSAMTIPSTLAGGVLILWGRDALKRLAFPLLFLFFMVPMPEVLIAGLNFELKMFTVDGSVKLFTFLGGIAERLDQAVQTMPLNGAYIFEFKRFEHHPRCEKSQKGIFAFAGKIENIFPDTGEGFYEIFQIFLEIYESLAGHFTA